MAASETVKIDPSSITLKGEENVSRWQDTNARKDDVVRMALSLLETGQTSPIVLNGKVPVIGFTRIAAGQLIQQGFSILGTPTEEKPELEPTVYPPKPDFTLDAKVIEVSAEEADVMGMVDNLVRTDLSMVDLGKAAEYLAKTYGWSSAEITRRLQITNPNKVGDARRLAQLPKDILEGVQKKLISPEAALEMTKYKTGQRDAAKQVLIKAIKEEKKTTAAAVRKAAEAVPVEAPKKAEEPVVDQGKNSTAKPEAPRVVVRGGAEIREFLVRWQSELESVGGEKLLALDGDRGKNYLKLVTKLLDYTNGKIKEETLMNHFETVFDIPKGTV
jgi:ParB-like chromosome segregation protein Spo0J